MRPKNAILYILLALVSIAVIVGTVMYIRKEKYHLVGVMPLGVKEHFQKLQENLSVVPEIDEDSLATLLGKDSVILAAKRIPENYMRTTPDRMVLATENAPEYALEATDHSRTPVAMYRNRDMYIPPPPHAKHAKHVYDTQFGNIGPMRLGPDGKPIKYTSCCNASLYRDSDIENYVSSKNALSVVGYQGHVPAKLAEGPPHTYAGSQPESYAEKSLMPGQYKPPSQADWPSVFYTYPYNKTEIFWPPGLYSRLKQWSPGFYTNGFMYSLRPGLAYHQFPSTIWTQHNGTYYLINQNQSDGTVGNYGSNDMTT